MRILLNGKPKQDIAVAKVLAGSDVASSRPERIVPRGNKLPFPDLDRRKTVTGKNVVPELEDVFSVLDNGSGLQIAKGDRSIVTGNRETGNLEKWCCHE